MVGPFFYSDDPIRDAAEYYEWLDYRQEEESEDDERYYPCADD